MKGNSQQVPEASVAQEVQPETEGVSQTPQQSPNIPQTPIEPTPPSKPKKRLKLIILVILIALVGLGIGIGGFFIWENFFAAETEVDKSIFVPETKKTEEEVYIYKGVWMPALGASVIPKSYLPEGIVPEGNDISILEPVFADFDKAKKAGINTFATQMNYWANEQGELIMPPEVKEFIASFIDEAHARGFKIWLNPEILHFMERGSPSELRMIPEDWIDNTDLIKNFELAIIETARFAEEHNVEIFSPSSEMYGNIGRERSKKLIAGIKPRIEAVYGGKICLRGEWPKPEFSDYSCFGVPVNIPRNEKEKNKLIENIDFQMQREDIEVELMVGEMWEGNGWNGSPEEAKKGFETALEIVKGKVTGIFILDAGRIFKPLFPGSFEDTIKEFYTQKF